MLGSALDCYICADGHGQYCLPRSYKATLPNILFGNIAEELTKAIIAEHCGDGGIFHAGAYVGDFFPALSQMLAPGEICISCEPTPLSFRAASVTLALNGIDNIHLHEVALSDKAGSLELQTHDIEGRLLAQTTRIRRDQVSKSGTKVASETIDRLSRDANIKVLHLDLEGYEYPAFAGARDTIARDDIVVIVENYQERLVKEYLADFTCFGEADNNYFFSRTPAVGLHSDIARARFLEKKGSFQDALTAMNAVRAAQPDSPLVIEEMMLMLQRRERIDECLNLALRLIDTDDWRITPYLAVEAARRAGRVFDGLLTVLRSGMTKTGFPGCAYAYLSAGLSTNMDLDEARTIVDQYVDEFPLHPELLLTASKVYERQKDLPGARDAMARAYKLRPNVTAFADRLKYLQAKVAPANAPKAVPAKA